MALSIEHQTVDTTALLLPRRPGQNRLEGSSSASPTKRSPEAIKALVQAEETTESVEQIASDVQFANKVAALFNTRVLYHYVKELDLIAIKIIDRDTEEVVKQIPPESLRDMHIKIRENLQGFILDHTV